MAAQKEPFPAVAVDPPPFNLAEPPFSSGTLSVSAGDLTHAISWLAGALQEERAARQALEIKVQEASLAAERACELASTAALPQLSDGANTQIPSAEALWQDLQQLQHYAKRLQKSQDAQKKDQQEKEKAAQEILGLRFDELRNDLAARVTSDELEKLRSSTADQVREISTETRALIQDRLAREAHNLRDHLDQSAKALGQRLDLFSEQLRGLTREDFGDTVSADPVKSPAHVVAGGASALTGVIQDSIASGASPAAAAAVHVSSAQTPAPQASVTSAQVPGLSTSQNAAVAATAHTPGSPLAAPVAAGRQPSHGSPTGGATTAGPRIGSGSATPVASSSVGGSAALSAEGPASGARAAPDAVQTQQAAIPIDPNSAAVLPPADSSASLIQGPATAPLGIPARRQRSSTDQSTDSLRTPLSPTSPSRLRNELIEWVEMRLEELTVPLGSDAVAQATDVLRKELQNYLAEQRSIEGPEGDAAPIAAANFLAAVSGAPASEAQHPAVMPRNLAQFDNMEAMETQFATAVQQLRAEVGEWLEQKIGELQLPWGVSAESDPSGEPSSDPGQVGSSSPLPPRPEEPKQKGQSGSGTPGGTESKRRPSKLSIHAAGSTTELGQKASPPTGSESKRAPSKSSSRTGSNTAESGSKAQSASGGDSKRIASKPPSRAGSKAERKASKDVSAIAAESPKADTPSSSGKASLPTGAASVTAQASTKSDQERGQQPDLAPRSSSASGHSGATQSTDTASAAVAAAVGQLRGEVSAWLDERLQQIRAELQAQRRNSSPKQRSDSAHLGVSPGQMSASMFTAPGMQTFPDAQGSVAMQPAPGMYEMPHAQGAAAVAMQPTAGVQPIPPGMQQIPPGMQQIPPGMQPIQPGMQLVPQTQGVASPAMQAIPGMQPAQGTVAAAMQPVPGTQYFPQMQSHALPGMQPVPGMQPTPQMPGFTAPAMQSVHGMQPSPQPPGFAPTGTQQMQGIPPPFQMQGVAQPALQQLPDAQACSQNPGLAASGMLPTSAIQPIVEQPPAKVIEAPAADVIQDPTAMASWFTQQLNDLRGDLRQARVDAQQDAMSMVAHARQEFALRFAADDAVAGQGELQPSESMDGAPVTATDGESGKGLTTAGEASSALPGKAGLGVRGGAAGRGLSLPLRGSGSGSPGQRVQPRSRAVEIGAVQDLSMELGQLRDMLLEDDEFLVAISEQVVAGDQLGSLPGSTGARGSMGSASSDSPKGAKNGRRSSPNLAQISERLSALEEAMGGQRGNANLPPAQLGDELRRLKSRFEYLERIVPPDVQRALHFFEPLRDERLASSPERSSPGTSATHAITSAAFHRRVDRLEQRHESAQEEAKSHALDGHREVANVSLALRGLQRDTELTTAKVDDLKRDFANLRGHIDSTMPQVLRVIEGVARQAGIAEVSSGGTGEEDSVASGLGELRLRIADAPHPFVSQEGFQHDLQALQADVQAWLDAIRKETSDSLRRKADSDALGPLHEQVSIHAAEIPHIWRALQDVVPEPRADAAAGMRCVSCDTRVDVRVDRERRWPQSQAAPHPSFPNQHPITGKDLRPMGAGVPRNVSLPSLRPGHTSPKSKPSGPELG